MTQQLILADKINIPTVELDREISLQVLLMLESNFQQVTTFSNVLTSTFQSHLQSLGSLEEKISYANFFLMCMFSAAEFNHSTITHFLVTINDANRKKQSYILKDLFSIDSLGKMALRFFYKMVVRDLLVYQIINDMVKNPSQIHNQKVVEVLERLTGATCYTSLFTNPPSPKLTNLSLMEVILKELVLKISIKEISAANSGTNHLVHYWEGYEVIFSDISPGRIRNNLQPVLLPMSFYKGLEALSISAGIDVEISDWYMTYLFSKRQFSPNNIVNLNFDWAQIRPLLEKEGKES